MMVGILREEGLGEVKVRENWRIGIVNYIVC